jgi:hypothetical protein
MHSLGYFLGHLQALSNIEYQRKINKERTQRIAGLGAPEQVLAFVMDMLEECRMEMYMGEIGVLH